MRSLSPKDIGALARQARTDANLTQEALAALIGASRYWVAEFERGKSGAELGLTLKALRALGLTLSIESKSKRIAGERAVPELSSATVPRLSLSRLLEQATNQAKPLIADAGIKGGRYSHPNRKK